MSAYQRFSATPDSTEKAILRGDLDEVIKQIMKGKK